MSLRGEGSPWKKKNERPMAVCFKEGENFEYMR
jgi:hypothetical protein